MNDKELIRIVKGFRKGILGNMKPDNMCFAVSSPLATFLRLSGIGCDLLEIGIVIGKNIHSHYCIILNDGRILDATASQFNNPNGEAMPDIYLGERPVWYQRLKASKHSEGKTKSRAIKNH